jgi:acetylornithine deacetylase/succinyl-diaminopimelate desuccinylase-like protein
MRNLAWSIGLLGLLLLGNNLPAQEKKNAPIPAPSSDRVLARDLLRELVEINTTPAYGSTKAAEAMAARLRSAGFLESDVLVLGPRPDRQNLVARIRGRGKAKPILLIAHLDVVDAPREGWSEGLDPFRLSERDGFFYGRGVNDVKNAVASLVASLVRLRAEGFVPDRDIVVALTADEETGNANGIAWLLAEHRDLMDVAYCLNLDGGGGQMENGKRLRLTVQTCEKANVSFRAETTSPGGHSALPVKDNAIYRLAAGLTRLAQYEFPFRFNETTRAYFDRLSKIEKGPVADNMRAVAKDPPDLAAAQRLATASTFHNAILRTTAVTTRLQAGHADNALPQTASAVINCRMFPGDTLEFVHRTLAEALADSKIKLAPLGAGRESPVSPLVPAVLGPIEKLSNEMWPGIPVLPTMDPWASDSARLRRAGIPTFGVSGTFGEMDSGNSHGANERLPVESFYESNEFLHRLLKTLTAGVSTPP